MKYTKKDFEESAAAIRALPMSERKRQTLWAARQFKQDNPRFDADRFFAACIVDLNSSQIDKALEEKAIEIGVREEIEFCIFYRWNKCDVDMALVPTLTFGGTHEVGKADMLDGGYDAGIPEMTPTAGSVMSIAHHWALQTKWPKGIEACGGYRFVQGYADCIFQYTGDVSKLSQVIEECKHILAGLIKKHVTYHQSGDMVSGARSVTYRGTGSGIHRTE